MANYYELLNLQPTATIAEIETAIDAQYDKWRRLVTHHDPNVVDEANRALRLLEQVRATLTSPEKRAGYDEAIGIRGQVGGLMDPEALLQKTAAEPLTLSSQASVIQTASHTDKLPGRTDAWVCSKCNRTNPIGTRHCAGCGSKIGIKCPQCKTLNQVIAAHCVECGVNLKEARETKLRQQEKNKIEKLRAQLDVKSKEVQKLEELLGKEFLSSYLWGSELYKSVYKSISPSIRTAIILLIVPWLIGMLVLWGSICSASGRGYSSPLSVGWRAYHAGDKNRRGMRAGGS